MDVLEFRNLVKKKLHNYRKKTKNFEFKIIFYFKRLYEIFLKNSFNCLVLIEDERNEQVQRKEVIVDASNIEVDEKEKEIGELRVKVVSEKANKFSFNQYFFCSDSTRKMSLRKSKFINSPTFIHEWKGLTQCFLTHIKSMIL